MQFNQRRKVFKLNYRIHSLAIEWHHGVSCVSNNDGLARVVGAALDRDQWRGFRAKEVGHELLFADEGNGVRVVLVEELQQLVGGVKFGKVVEGHEEGDRPGGVLVGQRDHHELATRPNVQIVLGHCVRAVRTGWDAQLKVTVRDVRLAVVEQGLLHHLTSDG